MQSVSLISLIDPVGIVAKGPAAETTAISVHLHAAGPGIPHRFSNRAQALKGLALAIGAFLRTNFGLALDFRQLKDNNRHDELL